MSSPPAFPASTDGFKVPLARPKANSPPPPAKPDPPPTKPEDETEKPRSKPKASPAELLKRREAAPVNYREPEWAGTPPEGYSVEVLKGGAIVDTVKLEGKSFFVFGRLPNCDLQMEHPSLSRHHALIQYRAKAEENDQEGFYLYDLGSTHGTFHNRAKCFPKRYYRLRVGHNVKLGGSTRMLIVQGPEGDMEEEAEETVTELQEKARRKAAEKKIAKEKAKAKLEEAEKEEEAKGISWGFSEDATEVDDDDEDEEHPDMAKNPFSGVAGLAVGGPTPNESRFSNDPKKALRGWFEREGLDLEYHTEDKGPATFYCRVELPLDAVSPGAKAATAAVTHKGKKKEAVAQCALEACRMLDRLGLLRQSHRESAAQRQAKRMEADDFYGSDDDDFLDRTGAVDRKRQARMRLAGKEDGQTKAKVETYESLTEKRSAVAAEVSLLERELEAAMRVRREAPTADPDDLDAYMASLKSGAGGDKEAIRKMRASLAELKKEAARLDKLVEIARPALMPALKPQTGGAAQGQHPQKKFAGIMVGKRGGVGKLRTIAVQEKPKPIPKQIPPEFESCEEVKSGPEKASEPKDSNSESISDTPIAQEIADTPTSDESKAEVESGSSSPKMRGPSIPEHIKQAQDEEQSQEERTEQDTERVPELEESEPASKKKRGDRGRKRKKEASSKKEDEEENEEDLDADYSGVSDPKYAVWKPPQGQTGDGRTSLNDKFGY